MSVTFRRELLFFKTIKITSILLVVFLLFTNCSGPKVDKERELIFMTFNIWQDGTSVTNGLEKIRDVIIKTNPDVVCFTEVKNYNNEDWTNKIINELKEKGYQYNRGYIGGDVSLITKLSINSSKLIYKGEGSVAKFDLDFGGDSIIVACVHLDYTNYACYLPRGYYGGSPNWEMIKDEEGNRKPITSVDEILKYNLVSERDEQIAAFLEDVRNETRPIILLGDLNEPSHLDWTSKTADMFEHNGVIINWQNTYALHGNNFTDAFRSYFPDEKLNPGFTWPSKAYDKSSTSWTPRSDERERIDFIFYKGEGIKTTYASLVGPKESYAYGKLTKSNTENENFQADDLEWPSDHKAVMVTLSFLIR